MVMTCPKCGAPNEETRVICARCEWLLTTPYGDPGRPDRPAVAGAGESPVLRGMAPPRRTRRAGGIGWRLALLVVALGCTPFTFLGGYTVGWASPHPGAAPRVEWRTRTVVHTRTVVQTRTVTTPAPAVASVPGSVQWSGTTWPIRIPVEMVNPSTGQHLLTYAEIDTGAQWVYSTPQAAQAIGVPVLYQESLGSLNTTQMATVYGPLVIATRTGQPLIRVTQDYAQMTNPWYRETNNQLDLGQAFWGLPNVHLTVTDGTWTLTVDPAS